MKDGKERIIKVNGTFDLHKYENYFNPEIIKRGIEVYRQDRVKTVLKSGNKYFANVISSNNEDVYFIELEFNENKFEINCRCPYQLPCKHAYAVLIAIQNNEYEEIELLEEIEEQKEKLKEFIKRVPTKEYNALVLDFIEIEVTLSEEMIRKVLSGYEKEEREKYFYNIMYNICTLKNKLYAKDMMVDIVKNMADNFIGRASRILKARRYDYASRILIECITGINDADINVSRWMKGYSCNYVEMFILLKKAYMLGDSKTAEYILKEFDKIEKNEYYNDINIEYEIKTIRNIKK